MFVVAMLQLEPPGVMKTRWLNVDYSVLDHGPAPPQRSCEQCESTMYAQVTILLYIYFVKFYSPPKNIKKKRLGIASQPV